MTTGAGTREAQQFAVRIEALVDLVGLESEWRRLEQTPEASFFVSWDWVGTLLATLPAGERPSLLRVSSGDDTVALALVGNTRERRRRFIRSRVLHLNETGRADVDALTLEHNGLVVAEGQEHAAATAIFGALDRLDDWDELFVSGLSSERFAQWTQAADEIRLTPHCRWDKDYYFVDLERVRARAGGYLEGLSSNTRHQIRRAMKLYAQRGPLVYRIAETLAEAREWFAAMQQVHQAHWQAQGLPGAFGSDFTQRFHMALVERGWPRGAVELARVAAGDKPVGYLYNFRKAGVLYNYQTGVAYEEDARLKPGLVCHALAADDAGRRGLARYDLLMGGGHYKQRLADGTGRMVWCSFQKRRLVLRLENRLRRLASRWHGEPAPGSATGEAGPESERGPLP